MKTPLFITPFVILIVTGCNSNRISPNKVIIRDTTYTIYSKDSLTLDIYSIHGKDTAIAPVAAPPEYYERAERRKRKNVK